MDEARLIRRLKRRDDAAFSEMVLRYQTPIFNLCLRMLSNAAEAEDVAQEVFVKCFLAIETFRGDAKLSTWLYRIALNRCRNRLKYLGRRRYDSTDRVEDVPESALSPERRGGPALGEALPAPDEVLEGNRAEAGIQRALAALDPEFRELVVLRDVEGLSYAEMVEVTGLAEGTLKSRLHRARAALREAWLRQGGEA